MIPRTADIIVIGGGVIGTSIAYHLARRGAGQVVLLEREHLSAGSTGTSSGLVRMHYDNPLEAEIALQSFEVFSHFDETIGGDCGFVPTGFLRTVEPHNLEKLKANVAMLQELGANTWLVSNEEIREMAPYLHADDIPFAAFEPDSGYADPHLTTMGFANAARRHGAQILQGVEVTGIELNGRPVNGSPIDGSPIGGSPIDGSPIDGGTVSGGAVNGGRLTGVDTTEGHIAAPVVVNAAGPWGELVAAMAGVQLDTTIMHHQVAVVEAPPEVPWPHLTVIDRLHHTYLRPETGRLTLIGASHDNYAIGPDQLDTYSQNMTPETQYRVLERLCTRVPGMETGAVHRGHTGIYANSQDRHALLGPAPGVEGLYCAVGCSGHGFKEAPAVGQAMAELVMDGRSTVLDITPLRLTRFDEGEPYQGLYPYE
jgi:sarcosine oxidase subunit beta